MENVRWAGSTKGEVLSSEDFIRPWYRVRVSPGEEVHESPRGSGSGIDQTPVYLWSSLNSLP